MAERRESVRVSAEGSSFSREFSKIRNDAEKTGAALRAIPDRVRVNADARGLSGIERDAAKVNAALRGIPNEILVHGDTSGFDKIERDARRAERSTSGLVDAVVGLGPALVPIGAVAVPALAGLTAQLGFAAGAAGTALLAFNGVGDALKALNAYQLSPTGQNAIKLNDAMAKLGPSGKEFVHQLDRMGPALKQLKTAAEDGVLPGVGDALEILIKRLPQAKNLLGQFSDITGDLARDGAEALAGPKFQAFFDYLSTNARPILTDLGSAFGNLTLGFANMLAGLAPLERDFSTFLANSARDFADWSATFADSEGFADFVDYVREAGPQVGDALGKIGSALLAIVEAAAPVGGSTLQILGALADVITRIADSPLGTPLIAFAAAIAVVNRALAASALAKNSLVTDLLYGRLDAKTGNRGPNAIGQIGQRYQQVTGQVTRASAQLVTSMKAANAELEAAQAVQQRIVSRVRANAQSGALIPKAQNIQAVKDYQLAQQGVATAERKVIETRKAGVAGVRAAQAEQSAAYRRTALGAAKGAAAVGALALATSGAGDKIGLTNTASLTLAGSMAGPLGAAAGAVAGGFLDVRAAGQGVVSLLDDVNRAAKGADFSELATSLDKLQKKQNDLRTRSGLADTYSDNAQFLGSFLRGRNPAGDEAEINRAILKTANLKAAYQSLAKTVGTPLPQNASTKQISEFAEQARPALDAAGISFQKLGQGSVSELAKAQEALRGFGIEMVDASSKASDLGQTLQAALDPKVNLVEARDQLAQAIRHLGELKGSAGLFGQGQAQEDNRALVNAAFRQTSNFIQKQVEAGASSDKLANTLKRSREQILKQGEAAGISQKQMNRYLDELGLTPALIQTTIKANVREAQSMVQKYLGTLRLTPKQQSTLMKLASSGATGQLRAYVSRLNLTPAQKKTLVTALTAAANGNISAVQRNLNSLRDKTITVTTIARSVNAGAKAGAAAGVVRKATGGWIHGPGGPREDKVPAWLSNGEYVVNARAAQKYAREIQWINAQGLANGGYAGVAPSSRVSVAAPSLVGASISGTLSINGNVATIEDARIVAQEEIAAADDTVGMLQRAGGR